MHVLNLYDYSARYYESAIGRFTSVDPLAEKYYSISPYAYVMNNPMKYLDPTGMNSWTTSDPGEIERVLSALKSGKKVDSKEFGDQWVHVEKVSEDDYAIFDDETSDFIIDGQSWTDFKGYGAQNMKQASFLRDYWLHLAGPSAIALGQPISFLKPIGAFGSKRGSSILSYTLSKVITYNIGKSGSDFALALTGARTTNLGRLIGRTVPIVGWVMTAIDLQYSFVAEPNISQIKENIRTGKLAQDGVYNPTSEQYMVSGPWGLLW